jgi:tetratricopeptide (TPR) repeat protein
MLAKALSEEAVKKNPENLEARRDIGWAEVLDGDLAAAEKTFLKLSGSKGRGEVLGKEGLAKVYAQKGLTEKALKYAEEVENKAPDSVVAHVIKGDYYSSKDDIKRAKTEYQKAAQKKGGPAFQKAVAVNKLGRIQAKAGNLKQARKRYNQAVEIDPYYIEATSNKGVTYEKEGKWDKALDAYRKALLINQKDVYASVLARRAQERLAIENDAQRKKRMDTMVKNLAQRYREQKKSMEAKEDMWTSRPMVLTFVDFREKGGLADRDGFATVLTSQLSSEINASGRAQAVERIIVERLIEELNIGSSEFANPETSLRLGKVLAAKIIGTGLFYHLPNGTLFSLRLIDTETTKIPKVITRQFIPGASLEKEIHALNREILKSIISKYPLRGYVVQVSNGKTMINLGQKQGVVLGTKFEVLKDQEPIEYKGKVLKREPISIAQIEIVQVESELCYAKIINQKSQVSPDDKVRESIVNIQ